MRISKVSLWTRWRWSTGLGLVVFAVLAGLDLKLKAMAGVGTADIQSFSSAAQFRAAFWAWSQQPYAMLAGFNLGLDYLLMPLYAASFFYSGIITADHFAPRPGRLRRMLALAAMVPLAGAICDAIENALQLFMMLNGPTDALARIAFTVSNAKTVALTIGGVLLLGALFVRFGPRRMTAEPPITL